jgi:hypothetical protein
MDLPAPAQDLPAPTPEQARATEAVFSNEENTEAGGLMAFWAAGMLAQELMRDAAGHLWEDEDDKEKEKSKRPLPRLDSES